LAEAAGVEARAAHEAPRDEQLDEGGIGAVLGQAEEVVEVLGARIGAEVGAGDLLVGEIGDLPEVVDPVEGEAHDAAGEPAVAASLWGWSRRWPTCG
jgi:hypothetical protein